MTLSYLGYSYKTTPIELRERLAFTPDGAAALMQALREELGCQESLIISTCNRVEIYVVPGPEGMTAERLIAFLAAHTGIEVELLTESALWLYGRQARLHLFRVAGSLESMVIGESQILGQVKEAFQLACDREACGSQLKNLLPQVFRTAKRLRTETDIARFPVSVSHVAVELAGTIFGSLRGQTVLVIGAGDMAELTVANLLKEGIARLLIANRTHSTGVALADKYGGTAVPYGDLEQHLTEADIVISSTGARGYIVDEEMVRRSMRTRRGRPVFFIDIAVPRDIAPAVNDLSDVYRYDVDDLQAVAQANQAERQQAAQSAAAIVEEELDRYERSRDHFTVVPTVKALRTHFMDLGEQELERGLRRMEHLDERDREQMRRTVRMVLNKLLHEPSTRLKQLAEEARGPAFADALTTLFGLDAAAAVPPTLRGGVATLTEDEDDESERGKILRFPVGN